MFLKNNQNLLFSQEEAIFRKIRHHAISAGNRYARFLVEIDFGVTKWSFLSKSRLSIEKLAEVFRT